jgi:hypothetical protein
MNHELDRRAAVRNMVFDLACKYGSFLPDCPDAESALQELAHLAGQDVEWARTEVMEQYEYQRDGGYL